MSKIVLASTSPYRKTLLARLGLVFEQVDPAVDETRVPDEPAKARAARLAESKAGAVAPLYKGSDTIIIASDQVAHAESRIFSKPGNFDTAFEQLKSVCGSWVTFTTAICVLDSQSATPATRCEDFSVKFRMLDDLEIRHYLDYDKPWDCAGSLKAESLGIALLDDSRGRDINALYGLPLMLLNDMLIERGINVIHQVKNII